MQEWRTILVPVDFSVHSRAAALRACELARASGASIRLIHALDLPSIAAKKGFAPQLYDGLRMSERSKLDELLADLAHRKLPLSATLEEKKPVEMITEAAARQDVELIVMGTHGYRGLERMFLGSVAERTILTTRVPVMTVKEGEWDAASRIRRILLATDFSSDSEAAVQLAIHWAGILEASVEVIHAIEKADPATSPDVDSESLGAAGKKRKEALAGLQAILSRMSEAGISSSADLTYGPAAIEIAKRAEEAGADLVVIGRRRPARLGHGLFGNVAAGILERVKCSVLLAPAKEIGS